MEHAILLISCQDQKGITAHVTSFIYEHGGNIIDADQHIDEQSNIFFMRLEWDLKGFAIDAKEIKKKFEPIAQKFAMTWELSLTAHAPRVAIFVSQHLHCLYDVLLRQKGGHLPCEIPLIVSNHPQAKVVADEFRIKFFQFPIEAKNKLSQELQEMSLLKEYGVDWIVLARYHQILSREFISAYPNRIINIHHSFLPAFAGKNPYEQAYSKGVKIIGATSHFVIEELDQGPIIDQDTVRISHRDSVDDLKRKGQDLEKIVLSRALRYALERKILVYGNKTVVFS